ncbi:transcription factor TGA2-like isoform X2 [Salvia miltiorrhiza]|uniref:transcription factor TGA2-like isoform X2 n=1 Tax=Salvia miltiorrhiza TaxID=226208 RepID=UPI0025ABE045|nr:transcription factor TGA2-like isoform X2 [Salvia miltiorrhiza]
MHSFFNFDTQSPCYLRDIDKNGVDFAELLQSAENGNHRADSADISRIFSMYNGMKASNVSAVSSSSLQFGGVPNSLGSAETQSSELISGGGGAVGKRQFEKWGDSADHIHHSHKLQTSTDNELAGVHHQRLISEDPTDQSKFKGRFRDQKELVKLAQNREAARRSRMRKKAYIQQLESNQQRIIQLDQALERARQQAASRFCGEQRHSAGRGVFDADHARWLVEHERLTDDLRSSLSSGKGDNELHLLVDAVVSHYDDLYRIKSAGVRSDMFHILSGAWRTPVERCLMWLGGFRSSDLLKVLEKQIQPLTEQQLVGICNLQQSCQQTEDALSQGMEALQQSVLHTLSSTSLARRSAGNVVDYASHMATAMSNIQTIEDFLNQADLLRLHTLQQLQRILSPCQAARALLAINDYKSRLRALSSLWLARPKE